MKLPKLAKETLAPDLQTFYSRIGWPKGLDANTRVQMEGFLLHVNGERRDSANVDEFLGEFNLTRFDMMFLTWMGLVQEGSGNTWLVPELYLELLQ